MVSNSNSNSEFQDDKGKYDASIGEPTDINVKKDTKVKINKKERIQKKELHDTENIEEFNYIGDKDDLKNLDHVFRETTGYEIGEDNDSDSDTSDASGDIEHLDEREKREKREKYTQQHQKIVYPFSYKKSPHFSQDYKNEHSDGSDIFSRISYLSGK